MPRSLDDGERDRLTDFEFMFDLKRKNWTIQIKSRILLICVNTAVVHPLSLGAFYALMLFENGKEIWTIFFNCIFKLFCYQQPVKNTQFIVNNN